MLKEESGIKEIIKNESGFVDTIFIPESGLFEHESGVELTKEAKVKIKKSIKDMIKKASSESGVEDKKLPANLLNEEDVAKGLINADSQDELQKQFKLFNLMQGKKNALRILKLNGLLDKIEDQAINRFTKNPGAISNKELLDYMNTVAEQIDKSQRFIDKTETVPAIQINQQKIETHVNLASDLDRDSKERVVNAITAVLKQAKNNRAGVIKEIENKIKNPEEKSVLNNNETEKEIIEVDTTEEK